MADDGMLCEVQLLLSRVQKPPNKAPMMIRSNVSQKSCGVTCLFPVFQTLNFKGGGRGGNAYQPEKVRHVFKVH